MTTFILKNRVGVSRIVAVFLILIILCSTHSWPANSFMGLLLDVIGFVLIVICALGRLWSSMYISGYKTDKLIKDGPYSIVRNPLYVFSFLGALGIGFSSGNLLVLALLIIGFLLYYPFVVLGEEKELIKMHGDRFLEYMEVTPRIVPKFSIFSEPDLYSIKAKIFRKSFFDVMWFFWVFIILQIIEWLHDAGILPVLFKVP